jgi:hypothetical protein
MINLKAETLHELEEVASQIIGVVNKLEMY